jgi:GT2 family glycosyltransferase
MNARLSRVIDLSVIIVNFNTVNLTRECLRSLEHADMKGFHVEIIVVDNGSQDGSTDMVRKEFPHIILIEQKDNTGFAKANNVAITQAKGRYILLLNSDTEVRKDTLAVMITFMDANPRIGLSTCKVLLQDGSMDPASHRGFPTPWASLTYFLGLESVFPHSRLVGQYHQGYKDVHSKHQIDSPSGAFFFLRRLVIECVGLLDEEYFMYGEDLDFAYRTKTAGFEIWFNPTVSILHKKKQSGRAHNDVLLRKKTDYHFYSTMKIFYRKHLQHKNPKIVNFFVYLGIDLKIFIATHVPS